MMGGEDAPHHHILVGRRPLLCVLDHQGRDGGSQLNMEYNISVRTAWRFAVQLLLVVLPASSPCESPGVLQKFRVSESARCVLGILLEPSLFVVVHSL